MFESYQLFSYLITLRDLVSLTISITSLYNSSYLLVSNNFLITILLIVHFIFNLPLLPISISLHLILISIISGFVLLAYFVIIKLFGSYLNHLGLISSIKFFVNEKLQVSFN